MDSPRPLTITWHFIPHYPAATYGRVVDMVPHMVTGRFSMHGIRHAPHLPRTATHRLTILRPRTTATPHRTDNVNEPGQKQNNNFIRREGTKQDENTYKHHNIFS